MALTSILTDRQLRLVFPSFTTTITHSIARQFKTLENFLDIDPNVESIDVPVNIDQNNFDTVINWCLINYIHANYDRANHYFIKLIKKFDPVPEQLELVDYLEHTSLINHYVTKYSDVKHIEQYPLLGQFIRHNFYELVKGLSTGQLERRQDIIVFHNIRYLDDYVEIIRPYFIRIMSAKIGTGKDISETKIMKIHKRFESNFGRDPEVMRLKGDKTIFGLWKIVCHINLDIKRTKMKHDTKIFKVQISTTTGARFTISERNGKVVIDGSDQPEKNFYEIHPLETIRKTETIMV